MTDTTEAGWFPDPEDPSGQRLRWWNGVAWNDEYSSTPSEGAATGAVSAYPVGEPGPSSSKTPLIVGIVIAAVLILGAVVAGAVLLASNSDSTDSTTTSETQGDDALVSADGASLVLPEGWTNVPTEPGDFQEFLDKASETSDSMADFVEESAASLAGQNLAMLAVAPELSSSDFTTNANLLLFPNEGESLDSIADGSALQFEQVGATDVSSTRVQIQGEDALRTEYSLPLNNSSGTPVQVSGIQYIAIGDEHVAILSISSDSASAAEDAEEMASSLVVD